MMIIMKNPIEKRMNSISIRASILLLVQGIVVISSVVLVVVDGFSQSLTTSPIHTVHRSDHHQHQHQLQHHRCQLCHPNNKNAFNSLGAGEREKGRFPTPPSASASCLSLYPTSSSSASSSSSSSSMSLLSPSPSPSRTIAPRHPTSSRQFQLHNNVSSAAAAVTTTIKSFHSNPSYVLTAILWLSSFGTSLERRTMIGKALSAPLATMALALTVANIGLIPFESSIYILINKYLVPLAVPLLLFDSDLKRVVSDTGTLLAAFGVGAFATVVGTIVAFPLVPLQKLGNDGWKVACALAARHIGGAINFVAVADTLNVGGNAVAAAIAADNVVVALYFAFLFAIAKPGEPEIESEQETETTEVDDDNDTAVTTIGEAQVEDTNSQSSITLSTLGISISVASTLVTAGSFLTKALLPTGTSSLPLISTLTVIAATMFPKFFSSLSQTGTALGVVFVQMFFAASGAAGSIAMVMTQAPSLFLFSLLQILVHFGTLITIGRGIFRLPPRELYLASNANVGGPTTAAAMAQAKEWKRLVLPALLIGILGYATATALALSLGPILLRLPIIFKW